MRDALLGFGQRFVARGEVFFQRTHAIRGLAIFARARSAFALGKHDHVFGTGAGRFVFYARGNLAFGRWRRISHGRRGISDLCTIRIPVARLHAHFLRRVAWRDGRDLIPLGSLEDFSGFDQIDIVVDKGIGVGAQ